MPSQLSDFIFCRVQGTAGSRIYLFTFITHSRTHPQNAITARPASAELQTPVYQILGWLTIPKLMSMSVLIRR